ncbi:YciI family protein [Advenella sp. RU8]|uniref:YciI family protein n=1 Tax=Advenella sp. RU8 TaxID=3399575 RepID=UPI003AAD6EA4
MRVLLLMIPKGYDTATKSAMSDNEALEAIMKYNDLLFKAGILLSFNALHPPIPGVRIKCNGGKQIIQHSPYEDVPETLGMYWMIKVKSIDKAVEWALLCPLKEGDVIEVRRIHQTDDFSEEARAIFEKYPDIHAKIKKYARKKPLNEREQNWEGEGGAILENY